jgi:MarR family transcriptional regulator, transcriptional regulator for hemolysin
MPEPALGFLIYDVSRRMREEFTARAQALNMTQAQWRTLYHLASMEGCSQVSLARSLAVRPMTLARVIDRLEAARLVTRRPDRNDRRAFRLYLTPRSKATVEKLRALGVSIFERAARGIGPREREQLHGLLSRMKSNLAEPAIAPLDRGHAARAS